MQDWSGGNRTRMRQRLNPHALNWSASLRFPATPEVAEDPFATALDLLAHEVAGALMVSILERVD